MIAGFDLHQMKLWPQFKQRVTHQMGEHKCDVCNVRDKRAIMSTVMHEPFCFLSPRDRVGSSPDGIHFGGFTDTVIGTEDGYVYLFMWHGWMSKLPRERVATQADWARAIERYRTVFTG